MGSLFKASDVSESLKPVLNGNLQQKLPRPVSKGVNIVLATSYPDFEGERASFWSDVVPQLQNFCAQFGGQLQIIDPYIGNEAIDLTSIPVVIPKLESEIQNARRRSTTVFFVGMIGDKYGDGLIPSILRLEEFDHMRTTICEQGADSSLLDDWYRMDKNAIPSVYILQNVSKSTRKRFKPSVRNDLLNLIRVGAFQAHKEGLINQIDSRHHSRFSASAISYIIDKAVEHKDDQNRVVIVLRKIEGVFLPTVNSKSKLKFQAKRINDSKPIGEREAVEEDEKTTVFVDAIDKKVKQRQLLEYKNHLSALLDKQNLITFSISGKVTGKKDQDNNSLSVESWVQSKEYEQYIEQFTQQILHKLKLFIGQSYKRLTPMQHYNEEHTNISNSEALIHLNRALSYRAYNYCGNPEPLNRIRDLIRDAEKERGTGITVVGEDCQGKTALLCEVANVARTWFDSIQPIIIVRFIGLTCSSSCSTELWRDICLQLSLALQIDYEVYSTAQTMRQITEWFQYCLKNLTGPPVIILLDDIHRIKYPRHLCSKWTSPIESLGSINLPQKLVVLVTCTSGSANSSSELVFGKPFDQSLKTSVIVPNLKDKDLMNIVKGRLSHNKRQISLEQEAVVRKRLAEVPNPFMATMLAHEACLSTSYEQMSSAGINSKSLKNAIEQCLTKLELKHTALIISTLCCSLEMSHGGLTEVELLDLLSSNQSIMAGVSSSSPTGSKDKKSRVIINRTLSKGDMCCLLVTRFPPLLWASIREDLGPLIDTVVKDGHVVLQWSHEIVGSVVRKKYIVSTIDIKKYHSNLADLFNDVLSDAALNLNDLSPNKHKKCEVDDTIAQMYSSDSQPLSYIQANPQLLVQQTNDTTVYNFRRLRNSWHHLLNAGNIEFLKSKALCHFPYLIGILESCGLSHLLSLFERTLLQVLHHDFQMLYCQVILPALDSIKNDSDQLASEIIGRLRYTRAENSPFLNKLVDEAMTWVDNYNKGALLVPLTCWIKPPKCKEALSFRLRDIKQPKKTVVLPTLNHQHLLVSGDQKLTKIFMYHLSSETLVRTFLGHTELVTSLSLANSGHFFVSTSHDRTVRVWDLQQGHCIRNLSPHTDKVLCSLVSNDDLFVISGSSDKTVKVTSLQSGRVVRSFDEHTASVFSLQLTAHGEFLITGSGDFIVRVWNFETGVLINRLGGLMAPVTCLALTANDAFLMVACEDETLRVFSLCSGTELHELRGHDGKVCSLASSADNCQVFAGCSDGKVYDYDLHNGQILETYCSGGSAVSSLQVTKDGWFLIMASDDEIKVCNLEQHSHKAAMISSGKQQTSEFNHLTAIAVSNEFKYAACGTKSGVVALWDIEVCQCIWTSIHDPPSWISTLTFSSSSTLMFSGSGDGDINVWFMSDGTLFKIIQTHSASIISIVPMSDGHRVASLDSASCLFIWPVAVNEDSLDDMDPISILGYQTYMIPLPHDDIVLKSSENPKEIVTGRLVDDKIVVKMRLNHNDLVTCVGVSQNGRYLVTGTQDMTLKVWQADNGYLTQVLVGHNDVVRCCAVADDQTTVISAADDSVVILWNMQNGNAEHKLLAHTNPLSPVTNVVLSLDGVVAFSADMTGWVYCWDTETGQLLTSFNAHLPVLEVMTSSDCHRIVLRLDQCPHLAIVCLHNTPASPLPATLSMATGRSRKDSTNLSISSVGSGHSLSGKSSSRDTKIISMSNTSTTIISNPIDPPTAKPKKVVPDRPSKFNSTVFDKLERNRSRASLLGELPTTVARSVNDKRSNSLTTTANKFKQASIVGNSSACSIL